jgi:hypothetical protein
VFGTCKLCLNPKRLCESHLMPAALYKACQAPSLKNPNPIRISKGKRFQTSKQVWAHLLCWDCEQRLNSNGENPVLPWLYTGKEFRLLNRMNLAHPHLELQSMTFFSGPNIGIDTEQFCYFALSIMWKAAVYDWLQADGRRAPYIDLVRYENVIRRFLLGEIDLPEDVMVSVIVCSDRLSRNSLSTPSRVPTYPWPTYVVIAGGVHFLVATTTERLPQASKLLLGGTSRERKLILRDCAGKTFDALQYLFLSD